MKRFITFLTMMCLPAMAVGGGSENQSAIDPVVIDALVERLSKDFIKTEPELVKFVKQARKNYSLKDSAKSSDIRTGFAKFVDVLSFKVFNSIKEEQIALLEANKKLTGREIIKKESGGMTEMWLDRGSKLESEDCKPNFDLCTGDNETLKCYEEQSQKFCDYPAGLEEHELVIEDYKNEKSITAIIESKTDNVSLFVDVSYQKLVNDEDMDVSFKYVEHTSNYDEEAEERNITRAALRKGEYINASYCWKYRHKPECKKYLDYSIFYPKDNHEPTTVVEERFFDYGKILDNKKIADKKKKVLHK